MKSVRTLAKKAALPASAGILLLIALSVLLAMASDPRGAVQVRNSLIAEVGQHSDFTWQPDSAPDVFVALTDHPVEELKAFGAEMPANDPIAKLQAFSRHLLENQTDTEAIQETALETYRQIRSLGQGYCADFSKVVNAYGTSAGVPIREWGMSFDDFSGDGHAFNEVFVESLGKWVMFDTFYAFHVVAVPGGEPLSVLELNEILQDDDFLLRLRAVPAYPEKFGFKSSAQALSYYRRGKDATFLIWGNDVLAYDEHWLARASSALPLSVSQLLTIVGGVYPAIKILPTENNQPIIDRLRDIRTRVVALLALAGLAGLTLLGWLARLRPWRQISRTNARETRQTTVPDRPG